MKKSHFIQVAIFIGWALLFAFAVRVSNIGRIGADVRSFQIAYVLGFAGYLILLWTIVRYKYAYVLGGWGWWLAGCILLRIVLADVKPSDDAYRYIWEGQVQLAGYDPYQNPPDDPLLFDLRDDQWKKINHPHFPAIYPPLAQMTFYVAAAINSSVYTIKMFHVLWDVITVLLLAACMKQLDISPYRAFIYGLCPLVLTAYGIEGHLDSLMLMLTSATIWAVLSKRYNLAGVMLGLAIASKVVLIILLPWFLLRHRRAAISAIFVTILCYSVYGSSGLIGLQNLTRFAGEGVFFSFLGSFTIPYLGTAISYGVIFVILILLIVLHLIRRRDFVGFGLGATETLVILLPIIHYWYVSWVILFMPFGVRIRWLVCSLMMVFYFEAIHNYELSGVWFMPDWVLPAVAVPFIITWLAEWYQSGNWRLETRN